MAVVPGLARAASVAELETQESELVPDAALLALAIGTREQVVVDVLPPELAHPSFAPRPGTEFIMTLD